MDFDLYDPTMFTLTGEHTQSDTRARVLILAVPRENTRAFMEAEFKRKMPLHAAVSASRKPHSAAPMRRVTASMLEYLIKSCAVVAPREERRATRILPWNSGSVSAMPPPTRPSRRTCCGRPDREMTVAPAAKLG